MAYDNPAGLLAVSVILQILATGAVSLRLLSRRRTTAGWWVDDWLIVVALIFATGLTVNLIYGIVTQVLAVPFNGSFRNAEGYLNSRGKKIELVQYISYLATDFSLAFTKLSVAFLYYRIFGKHKIFRPISIAWIVFITIWGLAFVSEMIFQCGTHLKYYFYGPKTLSKEYCNRSTTGGTVMVFSDVITDVVMYLLPLPMVARLNTTVQHKLQIAGIIAIGVFSIAASAIRAAYYINPALDQPDIDFQISITKLAVWSYVEVVVGILVACAITLRPLFANWRSSTDAASLLIRPFQSLRSSWSASTTDYDKERNSRTVSNNSSAIQSMRDQSLEKLEGNVAVKNISANDVESGNPSVTDLLEEKALPSRKSQDLGHIAVEKSYSVQFLQSEHGVLDGESQSGVPRHIAPFHHKSTSPRTNTSDIQ